MNLDILNILSDMKKVINSKLDLYELDLLVSDAVRYVLMYPKALDFPLPMSEEESVQKIMSLLDAWEENKLTGERFQEFFIMACGGLKDPRVRDLIANLLIWSLDEENTQMAILTEVGLQPTSTALSSIHCMKSTSSSTINSLRSTTSGISSNLMDGQLVRCNYNMVPLYLDLNCHKSGEVSKAPALTGGHPIGYEIIQNAIYALLGMSGKFLSKDAITGRFSFNVHQSHCLIASQKSMLLRLSESGFYHDQLLRKTSSPDCLNQGSINQAFIAKVKTELNDYHGRVSQLQDTLNQYRQAQMQYYIDNSPKWPPRHLKHLTLLKLLSWQIKPLYRLQWLFHIVRVCQSRKGGQLISILYDFHKTGNPKVSDLATELLTFCCTPMVRTISMWMLDGTITDEASEFFIESMPEVGVDRLWHDKFRLRFDMLPKFISLELAYKILKTGKSINFLRRICKTDEAVKGRKVLKETIENETTGVYSLCSDSNWHAAIETCYTQTSKHVLDIMVGPHKLLVHLQGMRRYLLLGQGDFVSIFIENIKGELDKLGSEVYDIHNLSTVLDAALRCTTAQYDDPEILNHLDVVVSSPYPGDCGWDVIALHYTVHGPLATMLEPMIPMYKELFKPLWRMKHMEFVLSTKLWKEQMMNAKALRVLTNEISVATYKLHMFTAELMHFMNELLYYVLFEVIECNWVLLLDRMKHATDLDEILDEHSKFLMIITNGCFVQSSKNKESHLEVVYTGIINLVKTQNKFYENCYAELSARQKMASDIANSELCGNFGLTTKEKIERVQEQQTFQYMVEKFSQDVENAAMSYGKSMGAFLLELNSSANPNLQMFGTRLDFNEFYKNRDKNISKPLTFEHMRMSNVMGKSSGRFSL